jgi:uncharacterized protein YcsI (UPF0317 family)
MIGMNGNVAGKEVRGWARSGRLAGPTCGLAPGSLQANLVVVPQDVAFDFLCFCQRNPKPCPVLDITAAGQWEPRRVAPGSDIRTDLPRYRVYRGGELIAEPSNIVEWWRDDLVGFLLGCSFSFEMPCSVPVFPFVTSTKAATSRCTGRMSPARRPVHLPARSS